MGSDHVKIERINENQIRCTLNRGDLQARQLSLRELAYGTDKARVLFREMIQKAMTEVGFDADDIPLMIEAIPLSSEGIMLIITKIEDPEELDTRFAKFAPALESLEDGADTEEDEVPLTGAEDILDALNNLFASHDKTPETADLSRCFFFQSLEDVTQAAQVLDQTYTGTNTLYKDPGTGHFYLAAHKSSHTPEEFNKICNIFTEYGQKVRTGSGSELYYREHYECVLKATALQYLAAL